MHRREFLSIAGCSPMILQRATQMVKSGCLGEIRFCRIGHRQLTSVVPLVVGREVPVIELDCVTPGMALLGSKGTLVMDHQGCRLFPASEV